MAKQQKKQRHKPGSATTAALDTETAGAELVRGPVITIQYRNLAIAAYCYIVLPILIFFVSWLRWYIGIPAAGILTFGLWSLLKTHYLSNDSVMQIPKWPILFTSLAILLWLWTSGIGGYFVPVYDSPWRLAIFRDLVNFNWPVIYPQTGNGFVYYFMYWMVPALFGKLFGFSAGNVFLFLWTYIGLMISFLLILYLCHAFTSSKIWIAAVLFFGFSGLNIVGASITTIFGINLYPFSLSSMQGWLDSLFNGYSFNFFYRSNNECLIQVFNQAIPLWITVPLILENKKVSTFMFIGLCLLPFAPLPFIGLLPIFFVLAVPWAIKEIKEKKIKAMFKEIFSIPNLSALVTIFPIIYLFFSCSISGSQFRMLPLEDFNKLRVVCLILFYILEFGIITLLICPKYRKSSVFYTVIVSLMLIPFFELGVPGGRDFCMNASIPALFTLMILTVKWILGSMVKHQYSLRGVIMIIVLTLAILSPIQDIEGRIMTSIKQKQFPIVNDTVKTFSDKQLGESQYKNLALYNVLVLNPETKTFYKYLARK
jgi:hypothetical protein